MKSRKYTLAQRKLATKNKQLKGLRKATTYLGTTFLMGAGVLALNKDKAAADTVDNNNKETLKNDNQSLTTTMVDNQASSQTSQVNTDMVATATVETPARSQVANSRTDATSTEATTTAPETEETSETATSVVTAEESATTSTPEVTATEKTNQVTENMPTSKVAADVESSEVTATTSTATVTTDPTNIVESKVTQTAATNETQPQIVVASTSSYPANVQRFLAQITEPAQVVSQSRGVYASLMIAQAAVESAWGQSQLATQAYNLFGVKWNGTGNYIVMPTQEYYGGAYHTVNAKFQRYASYQEALDAYATLILTRFPNSAPANAATPDQAAQNLRNGVYGTYATAPNYASTLISVMNSYNLRTYDSGLKNGNIIKVDAITATATTASGTYTVKAGDSLYGISSKFGTTVSALKSLNNLSSNLIYPNQVLKVKASATTSANTNSSTTSSTSGTYTVKAGDSLYGISSKFGTTVSALKSLNNLSSNLIYPNQVLKVKASATTSANTNSGTTSSTSGTYTVKAGDSLYGISSKFGTTVSALKSLNNLSSNLIYPNQVLKVKASATTSANTNSSTTSSTSGTYTVKAGDSLYGISSKFGTTVSALKSLNNLSSNLIYPNQVLKVKASATTSANTNSST
ncbi:LysM peptidoglycan-binding domain-containing protein, partial [Ligilactobacillus equi]|uniref:LysM peptidoglycan-binding domain-containing protein n=2 Tax=Ligilactobacillus equi TaxID=137357 RepID=UPI0005548B90